MVLVYNLFGRDVWSEFIKQNPEDLLEIKRKFEAKKRGLTAKSKEATIPYPPSLFKTYIEKRQVKSYRLLVFYSQLICPSHGQLCNLSSF
jgi:hypothetical protein